MKQGSGSGGVVRALEDWALTSAKPTTFSSRGTLCRFHVGFNDVTRGHILYALHTLPVDRAGMERVGKKLHPFEMKYISRNEVQAQ